MGLDISYYSGLRRAVGTEGLDDNGEPLYDEGWHDFYENKDFPGRADDVPRGRYKAGNGDGFSCGAYSRYNRWREELAQFAGYPATPHERYGQVEHLHAAGAWAVTSGPFWELINFSDCEGTIGTAVSRKLAADFAEYQSKVDALPNESWPGSDEYGFKAQYAKWRKAFEVASQNGAVCFH